MTPHEARVLRDAIVQKLLECPPEAIARLITSDPAENVQIQARATVITPDGPVTLAVSIAHAVNAPQSDSPPIPAEHFVDLARKGGYS